VWVVCSDILSIKYLGTALHLRCGLNVACLRFLSEPVLAERDANQIQAHIVCLATEKRTTCAALRSLYPCKQNKTVLCSRRSERCERHLWTKVYCAGTSVADAGSYHSDLWIMHLLFFHYFRVLLRFQI
jgi:hypothetical protein